MPTPEDLQRWEGLLADAKANRDQPITAQTFLRRWGSFSKPVALACDNGKDYVVKGKHAGRAIVNDQIIARLGLAIGAPVGEPAIVDLPIDLKAAEPQLQDVTEGLSHGTLLIPGCTDRFWPPSDLGVLENRIRLAKLAVLYGLCHANDHQLIHSDAAPQLIYSVDHGHFLPGGPEWTAASLNGAIAPAIIDPVFVAQCGLTDDEQREALLALQNSMGELEVIRAVAAPPDDWGVSDVERMALIVFFMKRRGELLVAANAAAVA